MISLMKRQQEYDIGSTQQDERVNFVASFKRNHGTTTITIRRMKITEHQNSTSKPPRTGRNINASRRMGDSMGASEKGAQGAATVSGGLALSTLMPRL
jgi:hypothetical protein